MKTYGDMPENDELLLNELQLLEEWFNEFGETLPILSQAKGFTCMAHDYLIIGMEEESERLLKRAEKNCPGYFKGPLLAHIRDDEEYLILIDNIKQDALGRDILKSLGFDCEQT
jgi:hypothetical protein